MNGYPHITVTKGMAGWFAVMLWWNPECGGFPEPYLTGSGRYAKQTDAIREAQDWAAAEELPFVCPSIDTTPARQDVEQQMREIIPDIQVIHMEAKA